MITGIRRLEKTLLMTMQRRYNSMANMQPRFETVSTFMFNLS
jgi:hypothetical protein